MWCVMVVLRRRNIEKKARCAYDGRREARPARRGVEMKSRNHRNLRANIRVAYNDVVDKLNDRNAQRHHREEISTAADIRRHAWR